MKMLEGNYERGAAALDALASHTTAYLHHGHHP